ncbi:hypothetical protein CHLRE_17g713700v5 [Chlamydomonas reinhardtii]|uniref:Indoleamine 2,3-dioxygenase n=1 Tax=Chlamydomonas reinhardtii TaxID=3055 RepID=A0A2K3CPS1_CHLRE|nr:uncharacterized protein CHLRE_17g713700v5 [Chlamydomonas reinhardtii]PNW70291.1 hypothetical protein CHLRE_17g713700v5 [Chlamydomonas reinhardtii]
MLQGRIAAVDQRTSVRRSGMHVRRDARAGSVRSAAAVLWARPDAQGFLPAIEPQVRIQLDDPAVQEWEQALHELPGAFGAGSGTQLRERLRRLPPFPTDRLLPPWTSPGRIPSLQPPLACIGGGGTGGSRSGGGGGSGGGGMTGDVEDRLLLPAQDAADHPPAGAVEPEAPTSGGFLDDGNAWRAYLVLSFLAHAYVWCEPGPPPAVLPAVLAVPWARVAAAVGMPPILTYATYNLYNWRRLNPELPPVLQNLSSINNFLGGPDEEWFRLVHVDIETRAGPAVAGLARLQQAAAQDDAGAVLMGLSAISESLRAMQTTLARIGECCDPDQYYSRVRPPIAGWRNNPLLPYGLVYEGVYGGAPVQLYGATGAQSSVVPAFDRVLDIRHEQGRLRDYLGTMVAHMPPPHRAFLAALAAANNNTGTGTGNRTNSGASTNSSGGAGRGQDGGAGQPVAAANVRAYVLAAAATGSGHPRGGELRDAYDCTVGELDRFRSLHRSVAQRYIVQPATATTTAPASTATATTTAPASASASASTAASTSTSAHLHTHATSITAVGSTAAGAASPSAPPPPPPAPLPTRGGVGQPDGLLASGTLASGVAAAVGTAVETAVALAGVTGTGGSDVIPALTAFRDATRRHKIARSD